MKAFVLAAIMSAVVLAGCFGGDEKGSDFTLDDVPQEITKNDLDRIEAEVLEQDPRRFAFPGQELLQNVTLLFEDTLGMAAGVGAELPNDNGYADLGGEVVAFDLAEHVPADQPVEVRMKLKWWGNPGASADMDIWTDVPGHNDAYDANQFDESMNWNIVTKERVVNTVHLEGEPFQVGFQVQNGKILHPDGVDYQFEVQIYFAKDVIVPGVPYELTLPPTATGFIFESVPLAGSEHIDSEFVVIGPDDQLVRHIKHNDIATETLFIATPQTGPHVVYAQNMHGGFLRVETDAPNPDFEVRRLERIVAETNVAQDAIVEPGAGETGGTTGSFDAPATFPVDVYAYARPSGTTGAGAAGSVILNITSALGHVSMVDATAWGDSDALGRLGLRQTEVHDKSNLAAGTYNWRLTGNGGLGIEVGYGVVTYGR